MIPAMVLSGVKTEVEPPQEEVRAQLDAILSSASFASSKRCQDFLRYIVIEALGGRADGIKERTIASDVFGKGIDYDSEEDSLVRVKAREVRKRLAAYYETAPEKAIRIELPLGGYAPRFREIPKTVSVSVPVAVPQPVPLGPAPPSRNLLWLFLCLAGITGAFSTYWLTRDTSPLHRLWLPVLKTSEPLVIFLPLLHDHGEITDRVGVGASQAAVQLAEQMTRMRHPYILKVGEDLSFSDLKRQPSLLLGGFSSFWTLEMSRDLRFTLANDNYMRVVDTKTGQEWRPVNVRPHGYADEDYGIVCRLFDSKSGQIMMIAAGTTTFGTRSAAEMLLNPSELTALVKKAPADWASRNFEAVIHTSIIGATPGPADVVAIYFW